MSGPGTVGQQPSADWSSAHSDYVSLQQQSANLGSQIQSLQNQLKTDTLTQSQYLELQGVIGDLQSTKSEFDQQLGTLSQLLASLSPGSPKLTPAQTDILMNANFPRQIAGNAWLRSCAIVTVIQYLQEFMKMEALTAAMESRGVAKTMKSTMDLGLEEQRLEDKTGKLLFAQHMTQAATEAAGALTSAHSLYKRGKLATSGEPTSPAYKKDKADVAAQKQDIQRQMKSLRTQNEVNQFVRSGVNPEHAARIQEGRGGEQEVIGGRAHNDPATEAEKATAKTNIEDNNKKIKELEAQDRTIDSEFSSRKSRLLVEEMQHVSDVSRMQGQWISAMGSFSKAFFEYNLKILEGDKARIKAEQSVMGQAMSAYSQGASAATAGLDKAAEMIASISSSHAQNFKLGNA